MFGCTPGVPASLVLGVLLLEEGVRPSAAQVCLCAVSAVATEAGVGRRGGAARRAERVRARSDVVLRQPRVHRAVAPRRLHVLQREYVNYILAIQYAVFS